MIIRLILILTPGIIWGLNKAELIKKKLTFSQFAIQQHINFKENGDYELYLENAVTPRIEKGRYKLEKNLIYLKYQKCTAGFVGEELTKAERAKEQKFACSQTWGDLNCKIENRKALTYSEVLACDRKVRSKKPADEKSPLMVLQNTNSRPKPGDIVQINGQDIRILPEKPLSVKNSTNIYNSPDELKIRPCPGPVACKAPYLTEIGKAIHPHGITVSKYPYKGNLVHWYVLGSDEYGLWFLPETGVE